MIVSLLSTLMYATIALETKEVGPSKAVDPNLPMGDNPAGISIAIKQEFFQLLSNNLLPAAFDELRKLKIPALGPKTVDIELFNITAGMSEFSINEIKFDENNSGVRYFDQNNTIGIFLNGLDVDLQFDYTFFTTPPMLQDAGIFEFSLKNFGFDIMIQLDSNDGHFQMNVSEMDFELEPLDMKLKFGGDCDLVKALNTILGDFRPMIIPRIGLATGALFIKYLQPMLNGLLMKAPTSINVSNITIDLAITEKPVVTKDFLSVQFNGTCSPTHLAPPPVPDTSPLPKYNLTGHDVQLFISDYFLNSLIYTLYEDGILKYTISNQNVDLPGSLRLDTTIFGIFFPKLLTHYGFGRNISLEMMVAESDWPMVNIEPNQSGFLKIKGSLVFSVNPKGQAWDYYEEAFTLDLNLDTSFDITLEEGLVLFLKIQKLVLDISGVRDSTIGTVNIAALDGLL